MSINLVDLVMKQVGGNLPGVLGSLLGESADKTQGALAGAIPAILGSLMGAASKGGDAANQLTAAVAGQDDSILNDLSGLLGSGKHQEIADQGSSMLGSLLGDGAIGGLAGAVGKFSGLGSGSAKSLLGMLVPVVMSVLGREQKAQGLDGGGLTNLLMSQKDNIASAMPSGMTNALGGAGMLDSLMGSAQSATASIGDAVGSATGAVGQAAGAAASAAGQAASGASDAAGRAADSVSRGASNVASQAGAAASDTVEKGSSWMRWALPIIILLGLIWLAFKFLGGDAGNMVDDATDATSSAVETTTEAAGDAASAAGDAASSAVEATTEAADDAASAAGDAASSAVEATTEAAGDAVNAASDAASSAVEATTEAAGDAASAAGDAAGSLVTAMVGDTDVGGELTSMFGDMTTTLSGITDVESAQAAVPALEEMSTNLDGLTGLADQLPEGALSGLSGMVDDGLSSLDGTMETLKAIPGVGDLIDPIIGQIKEKLAAFTTG
ncbi:MAG: DUF937 domain-containing protein [Geminicoccales bacterium]